MNTVTAPAPARPHVRSEPPPRADINRIEKLLKEGGWDFRFDPVAAHSYYTKLGSRIQIQGSGLATPNWTIYFNHLPVSPEGLLEMCAQQDAAYWHLPKLEAVLAEFISQGWQATSKKPLTWQVHRDGRRSIEIYLWGDELNFYTYGQDGAGREHSLPLDAKTLRVNGGFCPLTALDIIADAE